MAAAPVGAARWVGRTVRRRFGLPPRRPSVTPWDGVDVELPAVNGRTLRGWWFPAAGTDLPAVVVMHGWGASSGDMLPVARTLAAARLSALVLDARSHGRSDGDDFASMPRFAEDVAAGVDWLRRLPQVDPRRIALLGHSVGAGACLLAASHDHDIAAVVSISSMAHPGRYMHAAMVGRGLPSFLATGALRYVERVIGHRYDDFAPVRSIANIRCPVLLVHGGADTTVPVSDAHQLQAASSAARAELVVVPGAGHDDLEALQAASDRVVAFLETATGPAEGDDPEDVDG